VTGSRLAVAAALLLILAARPSPGGPPPQVQWHPASPRVGDALVVRVRDTSPPARIAGDLGGVPLAFSRHGDDHLAITGVDLDVRSGSRAWRIEIHRPGSTVTLTGQLTVGERTFAIQRLTLPPGMVDLDPQTERRALSETERLRTAYRTFTAARLWGGRFIRPVDGQEPGSGFGARRVINGQPRSAHSGVDYAAPTGTPVLAANSGRVTLVAEFFFPGRLVILDHGFGLHTLYFHLDRALAVEGQDVRRGDVIGTVGATGRATGPHLHFGAQIGEARVDPEVLLTLELPD
jgi:murein DD-endopeptidase MepM/ murein hydrolase activator NlpD